MVTLLERVLAVYSQGLSSNVRRVNTPASVCVDKTLEQLFFAKWR